MARRLIKIGEALAYNHLGVCSYYERDMTAALDYHRKHSEMARDAGMGIYWE